MKHSVVRNPDKPVNDICLCIWAMLWAAKHGRRPRVSELPKKGQIALGKKVFEFADYRDKCHPSMTDEMVYCGCLRDHGIDRDRPDGIDVANNEDELDEMRGELFDAICEAGRKGAMAL
jgi:hypothetical protein